MIGPRTEAALQRADLWPPSSETRELIQLGLMRMGAGDDDVLEITRAFWRTETHGGQSVLILTRTQQCAVLEPVSVGVLRRRKSRPAVLQIKHTHVRDLIDSNDEGAVIFFVGAGENPDFLLAFDRTAERDRFYPCVFAAQRGDFTRWGLQLDPAHYVADFDRFYAELVASGIEDRRALSQWVEAQYEEHAIESALGFATAWRGAELDDRTPSRWNTSARVGRIAQPAPWDHHPQSHRLFVRLGEQLYDDGLLGPPYDERSFDTGEPLSSGDAGPARLLALLWLAAFAHELRDHRATEFIGAARPYLRSVPAQVFSGALRTAWADIASLPDPEEPRELEIWEDTEVAMICKPQDGAVRYDTSALGPVDRAHVERFLQSLGTIDEQAGCIAAALAAVNAYEELSPLAPVGWRKLLVYHASELAHHVWRRFGLDHETAMLAQWVVVTIGAQGWGPDGNSSPLGQHHSYAMHLAGETTVGLLVIDPETGRASAPTGDEARRAADRGAF